MTTAPEIAYTDRDVREDSSLQPLALEYLRRYGGSFEPLVNAQELLKENNTLPTNIVRTVLNCMRYDSAVATSMPAPKQYDSGGVFGTKKKKNAITNAECADKNPHNSHWVTPTGQCPGIPWAIDRFFYSLPATVKKPYVRAKSGKLFHHTNTTKNAGYITWWPNRHSYGFNRGLVPDLYVRIVCKYPGVLRNPILLDTLPPLDVQELMAVKECPYCQDIISDRDSGMGF